MPKNPIARVLPQLGHKVVPDKRDKLKEEAEAKETNNQSKELTYEFWNQ